MLRIEDVSYRYQGRDEFTLKHVTLHLQEGEMVLLAGRSGCGKSTLIKIISGLVSEDGRGVLRGKVFLDGNDITGWPPERIGRLTGTVYQTPDDQLFAMTAADETGFALENQGVDPETVHRAVFETLEKVGLKGYEEYGIHQLSGGQRQRLALASVLITRPRLLILDEPVSQMNPQGVQTFMELLCRLNREEKMSILMIEHRVNELAGYFSRLAVMEEGRIIYDGLMEAAWPILGKAGEMGIREPQSVKLGRLLKLSALTSDKKATVRRIREECEIHREVCDPEPGKSPTALSPLVEAEQIVYRYQGAKDTTLHGVTFTLYSGQITALMGSNGAGKSTLLNVLGGVTRPARGKLFLAGAPLTDELGQIGYLLQEADLMLLADTVREELAWKNKQMTPERSAKLLKQLRLTENREDFPLALSKGQRLRVVLGAMLAKEPHLLLLDEPTTGQDEESLTEIKKLLLSFKRKGGSVFICTHDMELASQIADRVILLEQGRILADGPSNRVLGDRALLQKSGLTVPGVLDIAEALFIPPCITEEEVSRYVHASVMGRSRSTALGAGC